MRTTSRTENYGNDDSGESLEIQKRDSHPFSTVLEISQRRRDSPIPTVPAVYREGQKNKPELRNCVPWESANPRAGFPLSHRTDNLRRKETNLSKVSTMCPARCVYYVPVLTETHLGTLILVTKSPGQLTRGEQRPPLCVSYSRLSSARNDCKIAPIENRQWHLSIEPCDNTCEVEFREA